MTDAKPVIKLDAAQQNEAAAHLSKTTNTLILDYLLWLSAKTVLQEAQGHLTRQAHPISKGRRLVGLVDGLILAFEQSQQAKLPSVNLSRRLNLSALAILYVYRDPQRLMRGASEALDRRHIATRNRTRSYLRARRVHSCLDGLATAAQLAQFSAEASVVAPSVKEEAVALFEIDTEIGAATATVTKTTEGNGGLRKPRTTRRPTLLDALEGFIVVSAETWQETIGTPSEMWIDMACDFMLFACLEAYLVDGRGLPTLNAAFAWGEQAEPETGTLSVDWLFKSRPRYAPVFEVFERARALRLATLVVSPTQETIEAHPDETNGVKLRMLEILREKNYPDFKQQVLSYLEAISAGIALPELCAYGHGSPLDDLGENAPAALLSKSVLTAPGEILIGHDADEVEEGMDRPWSSVSGTGPQAVWPSPPVGGKSQPGVGAYYGAKSAVPGSGHGNGNGNAQSRGNGYRPGSAQGQVAKKPRLHV